MTCAALRAPSPGRALVQPALVAALLVVAGCGASKPAAEPSTPEPPASAEPAPPPPPPPAPSLYERLGKKDALAGVVEELMGNILADNRLGKLFDKARKDKNRAKQLSARMVAELCVLAGGGDECAYDGKPMKEAHASMNITGAQWDAFVEDLIISLKTRSVDDATAKELVDKMTAATKADIVSHGKVK